MATNVEKTATASEKTAAASGEEKTFVCANPGDWPRNGAILKGVTHDINGKMWLQVNEIQQAGTQGFKDVRGQEKWMPDKGGSWNGGQWLHEPKE